MSRFAVNSLRKDNLLIDPNNTETLAEYYLLENLALGLLRDDVSDVRGYVPGLAESWIRASPTTWRFKLREGLKWSDGSSISGDYIAHYFSHLARMGTRHGAFLKELKSVSFEEKLNEIVFKFNRPVGPSILSELSLADAVVVHETNRTRDWTITSGPYYVETYRPNELTVELHLNRNCPLVTGDAPEIVVLQGLQHPADLKKVFREIDMDVVGASGAPFDEGYKVAAKNAPEVLEGSPNCIYYFDFNPANRLARDVSARREFAQIVYSVVSKKVVDPTLSYADQMVPIGYPGHLSDRLIPSGRITKLKGRNVRIRLPQFLRQIESVFREIALEAKKSKVDLNFEFAGTEKSTDPAFFANWSSFKANQKDTLGSWSFLISEKNSLLGAEGARLESLIAKTVMSQDLEREKYIEAIHRKILDRVYLVPFLVAQQTILSSGRWDLSRWNPFDLRMRYYEARPR